MAENEPLSAKKFAVSFVQAKPWIKNVRFIMGLAIILIIGVTIYRAYFTKTRSTQIIAQAGSTVVYREEGEKEIASVIPYIDASYGRYNNGFDSWNDGEDGWKVEGGIRIEFDGVFDWLFKKR